MVGWCFILVLPLLVNSLPTPFLDCADLYSSGHTLSQVYTVYPAGTFDSPVQVYCDMGCSESQDKGRWMVYCDMGCNESQDKGRWMVIQRRMDGTVNFYRPWDQYKKGFGNKEGEYWLGLEWLHLLTSKKKYELRVDMEDFEGGKVHAQYSSFSVGSEEEGYKLTVGGFTNGGAGDSLAYHAGMKFTTFDKDQDAYGGNCAKQYLGAFWYNACHYANPNGVYRWGADGTLFAVGVDWYSFKGHDYSLKTISMKIRPVDEPVAE